VDAAVAVEAQVEDVSWSFGNQDTIQTGTYVAGGRPWRQRLPLLDGKLPEGLWRNLPCSPASWQEPVEGEKAAATGALEEAEVVEMVVGVGGGDGHDGDVGAQVVGGSMMR
jgi:hypothetical protein